MSSQHVKAAVDGVTAALAAHPERASKTIRSVTGTLQVMQPR